MLNVQYLMPVRDYLVRMVVFVSFLKVGTDVTVLRNLKESTVSLKVRMSVMINTTRQLIDIPFLDLLLILEDVFISS